MGSIYAVIVQSIGNSSADQTTSVYVTTTTYGCFLDKSKKYNCQDLYDWETNVSLTKITNCSFDLPIFEC